MNDYRGMLNFRSDDYEDGTERATWCARMVYKAGECPGLVLDRQWSAGGEEDLAILFTSLNRLGQLGDFFDKVRSSNACGDGYDVIEHRSNHVVIRGTPNGSCGYLYVAAVLLRDAYRRHQRQGRHQPETMMKDEEEKALLGSIEHWEGNVTLNMTAPYGEFPFGGEYCPCCQLQAARQNADISDFECFHETGNCLIAAYTGMSGCDGTPYFHAIRNRKPRVELAWLKQLYGHLTKGALGPDLWPGEDEDEDED